MKVALCNEPISFIYSTSYSRIFMSLLFSSAAGKSNYQVNSFCRQVSLRPGLLTYRNVSLIKLTTFTNWSFWCKKHWAFAKKYFFLLQYANSKNGYLSIKKLFLPLKLKVLLFNLKKLYVINIFKFFVLFCYLLVFHHKSFLTF